MRPTAVTPSPPAQPAHLPWWRGTPLLLPLPLLPPRPPLPLLPLSGGGEVRGVGSWVGQVLGLAVSLVLTTGVCAPTTHGAHVRCGD